MGLGATATIETGPEIVLRQATILGSWTFSVSGQRDCADFCARKGLPVDDLFTHSFALEHAAEAYRIFDAQSAGKSVLLPNG